MWNLFKCSKGKFTCRFWSSCCRDERKINIVILRNQKSKIQLCDSCLGKFQDVQKMVEAVLSAHNLYRNEIPNLQSDMNELDVSEISKVERSLSE